MRFNFAWRNLGTIPLFLLLASSCTALYDLSADQCSSNDDCVARFGQGYSCDVGICKSGSSEGGSSGKGSGGKAGSSATMAGTNSTDGGMDGGGTKGTSGSGGSGGTEQSAGTAGTGPATECESHSNCFDLYPDDSDENPRACINGTCVPLITEDCPVVLPLSDNPSDGNKTPWNLLKSTNALIIGAFAPFSGAVMTTQANNFDFALTEFTDETMGIRVGSGTKKRQIVTVLCNSYYSSQDKMLVPAAHLMDELKVPAVITAMLLQDQSYLWENAAKDHGVFVMNSVYSDQALIEEEDDNLMWNMLSGANALSVSYQPLLDLTEEHLRNLGLLEATQDLKVAHVKATDEPFLKDTAAFIEKNLKFNDQSISANQSALLYKPIEIDSIYKNATDPRTQAINNIVAFAPHVVIGTTSTEMLQFVIPGVESKWDAANPGQKRPFYLLDALNYGDAMQTLIAGDKPKAGQKALFERILGINWPGAADRDVYNAYQDRWVSHYDKREDGFENYYDSMYYLLYAMAAGNPSDKANPTTLTGGDIATGLLRIIQSGDKVPVYDVGPEDVVNATSLLRSNMKSTIELIGAMGPPNWDAGGGRNDAGSVWCVDPLGHYQTDQMRYKSTDSSLEPSAGAAALPNSDLACFTFPAAP